MATFNGEKYIIKQLESILSQLCEDDEIIISDDSSTDRTIEYIEDLNDKRIKLFRNKKFKNPIYNFENSIAHSSGEIIFMSDQDDLWLPHKVEMVSSVFQNNPDITLVASEAQIINEEDEVTLKTFYPGIIKFSPKVLPNIIKNRFLGCTLAFRRSILDVLLPFPQYLPMHDSWIGIMNQLYGRVHFIDTPLISYRRHDQNFTSLTRSSLSQMIYWRLSLMKAIISRIWNYKFIRYLNK